MAVKKDLDGNPTFFETRDLPLITFLSRAGYKKTLKLVGDIVYASFDFSPDLSKLVTDYYGHRIKVDPIEFTQAVRTTRSEILNFKDGGDPNGK